MVVTTVPCCNWQRQAISNLVGLNATIHIDAKHARQRWNNGLHHKNVCVWTNKQL